MKKQTEKEKMKLLMDKQEISDVLVNWAFWRDAGEWEKLRNCFSPSAMISISWFTGSADGFINAVIEARRQSPGERSKHIIGPARIEVAGNRAFSECNAVILVRARVLKAELDVTGFVRLVDLFEKIKGEWKIARREAIYEKDRWDFVRPSGWWGLLYSLISFKGIPDEFRHLGLGIRKKGITINDRMIVTMSEGEKRFYDEAAAWLEG